MPNLSETLPARKKRALSLIQPSGIPTLGNYLGAMRNWVALQDEFECIFGVADLHAVTVRQEPAKLRQRTVRQRVENLIAVAHPDFRAELRRQANRLLYF